MKKLFDLQKLAYITILALPLYLIKFSLWEIPMNIFELLALAVIGGYCYGSVGLKNTFREEKELIIPIVMIISGLLLSTLYNDSYAKGLGIIKSWFIVPILFSWICVQVFDDGKGILKAIYVSALAVASVSAGYFFSGELTFDGRLQAFYNSPNFLAMYLSPAIIIGIGLFKENKIFYAGSLVVILFSFYQTQSYAAWLAVIVAGMFLAIFFGRKRALEWKNIVIGVLIVSTVIFLQSDTEKWNSLIRLEDRSSSSSRMMIWRSAMKIGSDNAIFGIGPGNFQDEYLAYQKYFPAYLEWAVPQPHNLWLAFWLQAGAIGLLGFFCIVFVWIRDLSIKKRKTKADYICLGIMLAILTHGLVDTVYFKNDLAVIFWLIIFCVKKNSYPEKEAVFSRMAKD